MVIVSGLPPEALCVMEKVRFPTTIDPVRAAPVLAATLKLVLPFPLPLPPDAIVIQLSGDVALQPQPFPVETLMVPEFALALKDVVLSVTAYVQACASVIVRVMVGVYTYSPTHADIT